VPPTLLVAGLRGQHLQLFDLNTGKSRAVWFQNSLGRLRNVLVAPDGSVYFCSSNRDGRGRPQDGDDKIYRIRPEPGFAPPETR
jgi:glucose/arabinose dehydrogenase